MKSKTDFAYQAVYRYLLRLVTESEATSSTKLPSLRQLARRLGVSISTVQSAYSLLEKEGRVCSVPKSGYYSVADQSSGDAQAWAQEDDPLLERLCRSSLRAGMYRLGHDEPTVVQKADDALRAMERGTARIYSAQGNDSAQPFGSHELRTALAARYTHSTEQDWHADEVFIGPDLPAMLDAVIEALSLRSTPVLVESPCAWSLLRRFQAYGIRIIEIPLDALGCIDLTLLDQLLLEQRITLALLSSVLNPVRGSVRPAGNTRSMAERLNRSGVWVLENDSHTDLLFAPQPVRLRDFIDPERLITLGSFAKTLGPEAPYGYLLCRGGRIQWQRYFLLRAFELSPLRQKAIARLHSSGRFDVHLGDLVAALVRHMRDMTHALDCHLGQTLRYDVPAGGSGIWAESRYPVDMRRATDSLLRERIVMMPGELFSTQGWYRQSLRISFTFDRRYAIDPLLAALREAFEQAVLP
ncbi:PLP-dependent aminotransferase family protein [Pseudomonas viridiflava]|uniref:aminotransferase-like domain-containing protein n=1 Tax=Pseudomonas viridiflava TaxID=33069 RepID=UPI0015E3D195|nr:PLP-dependent aminotransferase family protein [Pseudomonas viridiflava]MBA1229055.1 PLP-dependent aminotransferase family protein [Pseudomonas viridiflava]